MLEAFVVGIGLVLLASAVFVGYRRMAIPSRAIHGGATPLLWEVLRRRCSRLESWQTPVLVRALARATRRCMACPRAVPCRAWLAEGHSEKQPSFCPNRDFLGSVGAMAVSERSLGRPATPL